MDLQLNGILVTFEPGNNRCSYCTTCVYIDHVKSGHSVISRKYNIRNIIVHYFELIYLNQIYLKCEIDFKWKWNNLAKFQIKLGGFSRRLVTWFSVTRTYNKTKRVSHQSEQGSCSFDSFFPHKTGNKGGTSCDRNKKLI